VGGLAAALKTAWWRAFQACVALFGRTGVASALVQGPDLLAQVLFTPPLAAWSIWIGLGFSARGRRLLSDRRPKVAARWDQTAQSLRFFGHTQRKSGDEEGRGRDD
jgi:hypothetical protein